MRLSKNFKLSEFLLSEVALRQDIDMTPPQEIIDNLSVLCADFLEPLRKELDSPIIITSGFRPEELNTFIGGSKTSSHMEGKAVDFWSISYKPLEVCRVIRDMELGYDQNIHEFGSWVHLGIGSRKRRQDLTAYRDGGKTKYALGLYKIKDLM